MSPKPVTIGHLQYRGSYANVSEISKNLQFFCISKTDPLGNDLTSNGGEFANSMTFVGWDLSTLPGFTERWTTYGKHHCSHESEQLDLKNFDSTNANRSDLFFFFLRRYFPPADSHFFITHQLWDSNEYRLHQNTVISWAYPLQSKDQRMGFVPFFLAGGVISLHYPLLACWGYTKCFSIPLCIFIHVCIIYAYIYIYASLIYVHLYRYMYTLCAFYSWLFSIHSDAKVVPESLVL